MTGRQQPIKRGRVWDPLVRLFHWTLAAAFLTAWFERSEAAIHETAGKIVLGLVVFRILWGIIGPGSARFESFVKGPLAALSYLRAIAGGKPAHCIGHNPAGAAMIIALLAAVSVTAASGMLMTSVALWGNPLIERIHGLAADLTLVLIGCHLAGVALAMFQHRENLPLSMISGRKAVPADAADWLGPAKFTPLRLFAASLAALFMLGAGAGAMRLANAGIWRMDRIIKTNLAGLGCTDAEISGPVAEIWPEAQLRYTVTAPVLEESRSTVIPLSDAFERRPALLLAGFGGDCRLGSSGLPAQTASAAPAIGPAPPVDAAGKAHAFAGAALATSAMAELPPGAAVKIPPTEVKFRKDRSKEPRRGIRRGLREIAKSIPRAARAAMKSLRKNRS